MGFGGKVCVESATVVAMTGPVLSMRTKVSISIPVRLNLTPLFSQILRLPTPSPTTTFRLTQPLLQAIRLSTGLTGLVVHPNPLPELAKTYESTLGLLSTIPETSVYRQGVEALMRNKLRILQEGDSDVAIVEKKLDEGLIEQALDVAKDKLTSVSKMVEWKA